MKKYLIALVIVVLVIIIAGAIYLKLSNPLITVPSPVACTMEAKLCPDGVTYVGRQGPKCEFALCPDNEPSASNFSSLTVIGVLRFQNDNWFVIGNGDPGPLTPLIFKENPSLAVGMRQGDRVKVIGTFTGNGLSVISVEVL